MTTTILEPIVTADPFAHISYVDPFPGKNGEDTITSECIKCSGTGAINWGNVSFARHTEHGNIEARWCFDCGGTGKWVRKVKNIRAAERRRVKAHNDALDKQREYVANLAVREAEEAARLGAFRAEHADLAAALEVVGGSFAESLTERIKSGAALTERQAEALRAAGAKEAAKSEQTWIGAEGETVTFEGKVEDVKIFEGHAYGTSSYLWIIRTTDGNKVTVYSSAQFLFDLRDQYEQPTTKFTATVKALKEYQGAKETQVARIKKVA